VLEHVAAIVEGLVAHRALHALSPMRATLVSLEHASMMEALVARGASKGPPSCVLAHVDLEVASSRKHLLTVWAL